MQTEQARLISVSKIRTKVRTNQKKITSGEESLAKLSTCYGSRVPVLMLHETRTQDVESEARKGAAKEGEAESSIPP